MKRHLIDLMQAWLTSTGLTLLLFVLLYPHDVHLHYRDTALMIKMMMAVIWLSIPGIAIYAALCLLLAMFHISPPLQLVLRLIFSWVYLYPFISLAATYLRMQSIGFAALTAISLAVILHWTKTKHGLTLKETEVQDERLV